jgi:hypothetical protein
VGVREADAVQRLTVDVELELGRRAIADAHRARPPVPLEVGEDLLVQLG